MTKGTIEKPIFAAAINLSESVSASTPEITSQAIKDKMRLAHSLEFSNLILPAAKLRGFLYSLANSLKDSLSQIISPSTTTLFVQLIFLGILGITTAL